MPSVPDSISAIAAFLKQELRASNVAANADRIRDIVAFRPTSESGVSFGTLEISDEALGDHEPEIIIADLRAQNVPARLQADPTMRLHYSTDRQVPHLESRPVECDGRHYRVVRDAQHNVRIYDSNDRVLPNMPAGMRVLTDSVFRRQEADWCADIRLWSRPTP